MRYGIHKPACAAGRPRSAAKDLAALLNVSQNTYSQYENGIISLTAEVLIRLADYYKVSIDYLLGQTDEPKRAKKTPAPQS